MRPARWPARTAGWRGGTRSARSPEPARIGRRRHRVAQATRLSPGAPPAAARTAARPRSPDPAAPRWHWSGSPPHAGPPTAPFQGGFGLMTPEGIRKPAYFAYKYLNALGRTELKTPDTQSLVTWDDGVLKALVWEDRKSTRLNSS